MKYIPLDALVAMINKRKEAINPTNSHTMYVPNMDKFYRGWMNALSWVEKEIVNSSEVKEVDLEKEYDKEFFNDPVYGKLVNRNAGISIAKHFFELGLKAQK